MHVSIWCHSIAIHELPEEDDDDSIIEDEPLPPLPIVPQPDVTQSKTNAESEGLAEEKQDSAPEIPSLETVKPSGMFFLHNFKLLLYIVYKSKHVEQFPTENVSNPFQKNVVWALKSFCIEIFQA